jgi:PAS domain S-box-containing protein
LASDRDSEKLKIFYVDDEPCQLEFMEKFLKEIDPDIIIYTSSSQKEAIEKAGEGYDCIISDYKMPGINGIELAYKIREFSDVPFILYTGQGSEEIAELAFAAGIDDYVRKELYNNHYVTLYDRIKKVVENYKSEKELCLEEKKYIHLMNDLSEGIIILDDKNKITFLNKQMQKMLGNSKRNIEGLSLLNFVSNSDKHELINNFKQLEFGNKYSQECTLIKRDGTYLNTIINLSPVYSEKKDFIGSVAVINDITYLKELNYLMSINTQKEIPVLQNILFEFNKRNKILRELKIRDNTLRDFVNSIFFTNTGGNIIYANKEVLNLLGYNDVKEIIDKHLTTIFERDIDTLDLLDSLKNKGSYIGEINAKKKDGSKIAVKVFANEITNNYKSVISYAVALLKIDESAHQTKDFNDYSNRLQQLIDIKTKELIETEKHVAIGKISSMVVHDLRSPLQTIKNSLYLIKKSPKNTKRMIELIEKSVDYVIEILEEIRTQMQITPLIYSSINIPHLIKSVIEFSTIPPNIEVNLQIEDGLDNVYLDRIKIQRVLDNHIRNAIEAMPEGGVLSIKAYKSGDEMVIKIADTGIGIPKEILPKLFETFVTTKPQGMGLGLTFCKRTVEAHGGEITVDSEEGDGTTFTLKFPFHLE